MTDESKNIYGLSEGIFKACQFLGLKFPPTVPAELQPPHKPVPSDYFGDNFELDETAKVKLCAARKWTNKKLEDVHKRFSEKFASQKPLGQNRTDLNVYFCDLVLFADKQNDASVSDYFDFEFYAKSFELRQTFATSKDGRLFCSICNEPWAMELANDKANSNKLFAEFLHRDWLDTRNCTFEEFQAFVEKHPHFLSKPIRVSQGKGAEIINDRPNENLKTFFANLKKNKSLLEEVVTRHEDLVAFCPDTLNTIRVYTVLDTHNAVHILATDGRMGMTINNLHGVVYVFSINPKTGVITSDGINDNHEVVPYHLDTGKKFKGFQYPFWKEICSTVTKMAKRIPQLRYMGWDITINDKNEVVLIEVDGAPATDILQADGIGRKHLYMPLIEEIQNYKRKQLQLLGWRVNHFKNFRSAYDAGLSHSDIRLKFAMDKLIPDCATLMDVGCRKAKLAKAFCPEHVKYYPVDYEAYDEEIIACDFNEKFPDIKVDACLCAFTAEFVAHLPKFLANMCNATQKQILMWCRPFDKETNIVYRWDHPFLTDFTEEFLIKTMEQNNFQLNAQYFKPAKYRSVILYDFRRI